jgi:hypothetical protein
LKDEMVVSVFFPPAEEDITIWNALGWGASAGLYLQILDWSGREFRNDLVQMFHPPPPDRTGKNAPISIGGNSFAGFDSQILVKALLPGPGRYTARCLFCPPLPRDYFQGRTIGVKADAPIESAGVPALVDQ